MRLRRVEPKRFDVLRLFSYHFTWGKMLHSVASIYLFIVEVCAFDRSPPH